MADFVNVDANEMNRTRYENRLEKEDKFITALFYDGDDSRENFDLTILGTSQVVDKEHPEYKDDKKKYLTGLIGENAESFLNRFKDELSDFSEVYILGKIKKR